MQQIHRSGPLKQQNKAHKHGKHRSKGQRDDGGNLSNFKIDDGRITVLQSTSAYFGYHFRLLLGASSHSEYLEAKCARM